MGRWLQTLVLTANWVVAARPCGSVVIFLISGSSAIAVRFPVRIGPSPAVRGCRLTYLELDRRISQLARALLGLGLKKGDFLGVMLWNEHAVVETIFACARAGIIVAPLNVRLLAEEVVPYVNFHGCKAIVTNADFEEKFEKADATIRISTSGNEGWLEYESLISGESGEPLTVVTSLDDPVRLVSTGGTTGMSKGVLHSHVGTLFTVLADIAEYGADAATSARLRFFLSFCFWR